MILLLAFMLSWPAPQAAGYPSPEEFGRRIRHALAADAAIQKGFTWLERRRDVKISKLGKVTIGPLRTFQVYPSEGRGGTYKRLIAVDGKPLSAEELARRDAERERDLLRDAARARTETPNQREDRLAKEEEEHRNREAMLQDALRVFEPTFVGREAVDGEQVLVVDLAPRPDARVTTREGRWMQHFAGRIWVDESDYQVVKLDMQAVTDVTIGWGIIGRIHKGSRILFTRQQVEGVWLPAQLTYEASGRTLLFRPFAFTVTTTYSDYRRITTARDTKRGS